MGLCWMMGMDGSWRKDLPLLDDGDG